MAGLPAGEWFALCHTGQLQKCSVVWPRCEEFPNGFVQLLSIPVLSLCCALFDDQKGDAPISVSPPPLRHLALAYCSPFRPVFTKTLVCVTILSCKLK